MKLRYLFLLPELVLLFFFVFPIFKRICNPGNLAGILVCLFLLFVTLFPQVFAQWIRHLWGHLEAVQQNANLQSLHRHCLLSPIFSRNSISHFLAIVNNKKTGSTAGDFLFCTAGFLLVIYFICRQISRKLSTLTYPVTYFPAGVLPQYSLRVVIRKRPSLHCLPS